MAADLESIHFQVQVLGDLDMTRPFDRKTPGSELAPGTPRHTLAAGGGGGCGYRAMAGGPMNLAYILPLEKAKREGHVALFIDIREYQRWFVREPQRFPQSSDQAVRVTSEIFFLFSPLVQWTKGMRTYA